MKYIKNQDGIAHVAVIVVAVVTVVVVAVGFRVLKNNDSKQNKVANDTTTKREDKVTVDAKNLNPVDGEVIVPKGQQKVLKPTTSSPSVSSAAQTVQFTKGGAGLDGSYVIASATTNDVLDGTCYFTFTLGNSTVKFSNKAAGKECWILSHVSSFPKNGNWTMSMQYISSDGKTTGSVQGYTITINPQPRTINFTKGGASETSSGVVSAASNLSENVTGTCTYTFSLNGTVRVEKSNYITDSNRCENTMITGFPKSGTYQYTLTFKSNDNLISASQGAFDVTVSQ